MQFSILSFAAILPLAYAADSTTQAPAVITAQYGYTDLNVDRTQYYSILTAGGLKPAAASYALTVADSNTAVQAAISALYAASGNIEITGSLESVLATGTLNPVQGLQYEAQQLTLVPSQYRSILSSVINQELALQTAAAAPRQQDLVVSAAVAGVVGVAAGLAAAL